jgi:hypothetical protein
MAMQNFYDPPRPQGFTDALEKHRFVSLHIYTFPDFAIDDNLKKRVQEDVERASQIWCNGCPKKFEIFASTIQQLSEKNPGDLTFDPESVDPKDFPKVLSNLLLAANSVYRPGCSDTEVAVYYVKGKKFKDGNTSGYSL